MAVKTGLTVLFDNVAKMAAGIEVLASKRVMVGVPADKAARKDGPINNAALAYIHDKGAPEANIPARPFMEPAIEGAAREIRVGIGKAGQLALDGKPDAVERQYHRVGAIGRDAIKAKITDGPFQTLTESTLKARARRGRKGAIQELANRKAGIAPSNDLAKPLIDTGSLRASINYVVRNDGEK